MPFLVFLWVWFSPPLLILTVARDLNRVPAADADHKVPLLVLIALAWFTFGWLPAIAAYTMVS